MKRKVLTFLGLAVAAAGLVTGCKQNGSRLYPATGIITSVKDTGNGNADIQITLSNGNVFEYSNKKDDNQAGNVMSVMLDDNGTKNVRDDKIVKSLYSGKMNGRIWLH